jgi:D-cysteine desulfhydrase
MLKQLLQRPRYALLEGRTPIQRLRLLEHAIGGPDGPGIYVKRDDLMGIGGGGNKLRKLEFLIGDALAQGCDTFITTGARQSNHARLSAAAAARAGLACELVLTDTVPRDDEAYRRNGNVLLDDLFGATVHRLSGDADALTIAQDCAAELLAAGRRPYVVGSGGSSPVGCLGYVACAAEIVEQERELGLSFSRIVVPNGSSGTHAGLAAGFRALGHEPSRVTSFSVLAPIEHARETTHRLAAETLALINPHLAFDEGQIAVLDGVLGEGYGVPTSAMIEAVRLVARSEGLLLDPVYGGKAFAGLLAAFRSSSWGTGPVLFVMTGGLPGLFAYEPAFRIA